jgi:aminomethyltransferase
MCYPDGGCVDDLIIYRISKEEFLICLNASNAAKDIAWMNSQVGKWDVKIIDECSQWAQLALQGPFAEKILSSLTDLKLDTLKRFGFLTGQVAGVQNCIIARTGYTGSPGFEIYTPAPQGSTVARAILEKGKPDGLLPIGLGARDSLRLEAGYPLYGHELSEKISPIQAGLSWTVKFSKPQFIGRDSLLRQTEKGVVSKVIMYSLDDRRIARPGATVFSGDQAVGEILSGTLSPILNKPIGTALVASGINPDTLTVDIRGTRLPLQITQTPFFK